MSIAKGLRQHWMDSDAIRDKIDGRVYAGRVPDGGKMPCVVLQTISTMRNYHLGGEAAISTAVMQADIYGESYSDVSDIAELIRNRTSGYSGSAGDETIAEVTIIREGETVQQPVDGSGKWTYRHSRDFNIFYTTTVPDFS